MKTIFCSAELPIGDGHSFFLDGNGKITRDNGTYREPKPNAFSLPHISSCPGSTPQCRQSCYVNGLQKNAPEVYAKYSLNAAALHSALLVHTRASRAAAVLADWITENARAGFRWHVSGDVMHWRHAAWITEVCGRAPKVPFWIYTRTLDVVPELVLAPNLAVNISADWVNWTEAEATAKRTGARICYLTSDGTFPVLPEDSVIFPDYELRGRDLDDPTTAPWWQRLNQYNRKMVCPADFLGQSESARCGPCTKCLGPVTLRDTEPAPPPSDMEES